MNKETASKIFSELLDQFYENNKFQIDAFCYFADDFEQFKQIFVNQIVNRILNPPYLRITKGNETTQSIQPVLLLYYLIDVFSKYCHQGYRNLFSDKLPTLFEYSLSFNDQYLTIKLHNLLNSWFDENVFDESVLEKLKSLFPEDKPQGIEQFQPHVIMMQNPIQGMMNSYTMNQNPQIYPMNMDYNMFNNVQPQVINATLNDDDKRMCRTWMRNALDWETPNKDFKLTVCFEGDDDETPKDNEAIQFQKITEENQNATCISCSGTFKKGSGPNGEECFIGVAYIPKLGYIHQKCLSHFNEDKKSSFADTLFN